MAQVKCKRCGYLFDSNNKASMVTRATATAAGAGTGAYMGSGIGIVMGALGGIAGTVPGAIFGAITAYFVADQFRKCPNCGKVFKI